MIPERAECDNKKHIIRRSLCLFCVVADPEEEGSYEKDVAVEQQDFFEAVVGENQEARSKKNMIDPFGSCCALEADPK